MREIRQSGSEGGVALTRHPYPYGHKDGTGGLKARDIGSGHEYRIGHRGRGPVSWDGIVGCFTRRHEATKGGGWLCRCSIRGVGEAGVVSWNLR